MDKQNPYILIVDADPNMIRAVSESFGAKGFDLISAQTGSEALIQIGKRHADVALIDVQRGDMTGLDLLREIKSLSSETECIFLTGNTAQSSAIKAVQAGIFGFFQKPFDLEQILLSIQHAVEKKQSAQALQESERLAHAALDALSSHIAVLDESGKIIAVNRAWRIFAAANLQRGLELNSFVGENYLSVCETSSGPSSEGAAEMAAGIRSVAMGKQEQFSLEYPCHSPNERRWFNAHVSRFSGAGSLRIIVSHENITERILAEETLRDREASLQTILQSTADGILAVNNEGKILYANERFVRMWRIPKTVMDGGDDAALIEYILGQLIDSQSFLQKVQELYKSDEESFDTLYFKDGRIFERLSRPMLQETKPRGRVWSFRDITERKLADALTLRQSEHLQLLYDASQRLNRTLDLDEIYQAICDFMSVIAPNDGLVVSSFDPESQLITCRAYWMGNKWLNVGSFPTIPLEEEGKGAQSIAIRTGRSMLVNDYQTLVKTAQTSYYVNDETNQMDKEIPPEDEEIPRSALIVPLKTGEMVSGVIQVLSYQLNAYTEDQLKLLEALALHIASAEKNALLYAQVQAELDERKQAEEEMRQRMIELELLYDSGLAFSQLLSPKDIGSKIIELLEQKMDWHHTAIRLYDPKTNAIQLLAFNQRRLIGTDEITRMEELLRGSVIRLDRGLSGWVVQHGQIVRSDDLAHDERYFETLPGMKSGLYVPIKLGGRVIGVITIESEKPNAFSEADERLTSTLANQAASVLENARLFDETQRHIRELTALHRTSQTLLAAHLDPEQIYAAVHQAVAQTMPCEAFMIVLDDANRGEYHAVYFFDKGERFPARWLPRNAGISGRVISSGQTLLINDVLAENVQATYFGSMELTRSILAVPLRRGAEIVGMMSTQSYQPNAFGEPQRALLETITAHLSSTLDNAHLYLQTQARINELETLHVISTSLRTLQTVDEALSTILDNTLATLETDAGSIMLYDPPSKELRDVVARGWFTNLDKIPIKAGEGVAGTVFVSGELHYTVEFVRDTLLHAATRARVPSGWGGVCLPIRTSTEIIGVMFISVQLPRQITPQQIRLLESLVDMAGAALHRMSLHNETARRAEEFAVLYETSKALSAEYDLNSLLGVIVNGARNMLNAAASGMYLYHAESKELELVMDTVPTIPIGSRLLLGEGVAGKVAQSRQPLRIEDYLTWEGRSLKFGSLPIRAVIEVPMLYAGELIGVLTADEIGDSSRKFTDADERLLSLFASQAAGAINAARHREETIHYAEELERRVIERTAEIEATRHRLDLAASAGGIGVWEVNLKDNTVFWDTQMHIIHGTGKMDFDNSVESWWKMLHPEDVARTQKQFENALQNNGMFMDEYRILLPDASMRYIAANAIVLYDAEHNPERVIGVNMDITERKKSEEILYHANMEMERALRTKDEFLATMSHELRTPLNSILGISESLEEQFVGTLNEKQLKYTGIIRESGRHLLELINDILDISKIEAGRMELEIQNLSVEKVCQSSLRMIRELAQRKNLNVSFEIKGNVKTLLGDERRLKQSLVNLLGNAVKFTPQGGAIGLEVEGYAARNEVTFTVWDKGVGIADEDIQHLFKPFVQLDSGLAREYQGTGLGLALVSQMIRLHGGRVHVESILGQGSRFIITMPWMKDQQNTQVAGTGELSARRLRPVMRQSGKILLVEDTNVVVTLMTEYLHFKGYKVLIARNGVEGVQLAKQEHPDLILMDVMMPVMDGLEATRQIRADASLRNIPIIALTALAMTGDRERCLAAGMNDYLSKPIKMQKLADMIEKYLGAGRPVVQPE